MTGRFRWIAAAVLAVHIASAPILGAERLMFVKGRTIRSATLDSMMLLPGEGVLESADVYMGFANVAFLEDDVLVHSIPQNTFSTYRDSPYFQSGILEHATPFELFVHVPPSPGPVGFYEYATLHGTATLNEVLDHAGGVVFYDLLVPRPPGPIRDTTPPVLNLPAGIVVEATSPEGAEVDFLVTADDNQDPNPRVVCEPASGSLFPIGDTTVSCTASDASGNETEGEFLVTVNPLPPLPPIADLAARARPGEVTLTWSPIEGATGYDVYRRSSTEDFTRIVQGHSSAYSTYIDRSVVNDVTYVYVVRWRSADGRESAASNEASATPSVRRRR